jgi:hypothetical protein
MFNTHSFNHFNPVHTINVSLNPGQITANNGFRSSTALEIAKGAPPFVYDIKPNDSPLCATSKTMYNHANENCFGITDNKSALDAVVTPLTNRHMLLKAAKSIEKHCTQQFNTDVVRFNDSNVLMKSAISSTILDPSMIVPK